jgi:hypothetical protein
MRTYSILLLAAILASCGTMRKSKSSFHQETAKHELSTRDSTGTSLVESSVKKVDSSHVIEKEESGYERETVEVITETPYMQTGQEYLDTPSFKPLQGGAIPVTRTITRTIKEKGQKVKEITAQAAVKEETREMQQQAALVKSLEQKDTTATVKATSKQVERTALPWWAWGLIIVAFLALIYKYRYKILGVWNWALYRLIGRKPPNYDRT